jgi:hypothetical protein
MGRTNGAVESEAAAMLKIAKKTFGKRRDAVGKGGKSVDTCFSNSGGSASGVGGGSAGGVDALAARPVVGSSGSVAGGAGNPCRSNMLRQGFSRNVRTLLPSVLRKQGQQRRNLLRQRR